MRFVLAAVAIAFAAPAAAVTVPGLYNTGVGTAGVATTGNGADLHWSLAGGLAYNGGVNATFPIGPWLAETAISRWLTPTGNAGDSFDPSADGLYNYSLTFDLAGFKPGTAAFSGLFASDNTVAGITLNGAAISGSGGSFSSWTGFSSTGGTFASGLNTLVFTVRNAAQSGGNPTGLRVEFTGSDVTPVPEAATWIMMMAGFGLVGVTVRRRRGVVAA